MKKSDTALLAGTYLLVFLFGIAAADVEIPQKKGFEGRTSADGRVVAVDQSTGKGVIGNLTVNIEPGTGKVLLSTNPFIKTGTQRSAKIARNVAERITGKSLENSNVLYSFSSLESNIVGGSSAGAQMTLLTIAAIQGRRVPDDTVVTGTIRPDGYIGKVGGITAKVYAAGRAGMEKFYLPEGQSTVVNYRRVTETEAVAGYIFRDTEYVRQVIDLEKVARQRFGMNVEEVSHIKELSRKVFDGDG
ncbi:MAG: S16 family serine protease [Candidatus Nanohaloarchaea archaeon]